MVGVKLRFGDWAGGKGGGPIIHVNKITLSVVPQTGQPSKALVLNFFVAEMDTNPGSGLTLT